MKCVPRSDAIYVNLIAIVLWHLSSVYETPSMGLLDKKSLKIEGVRDFCWSPSKLETQGSPAILSVYVPESASGNQVDLMDRRLVTKHTT